MGSSNTQICFCTTPQLASVLTTQIQSKLKMAHWAPTPKPQTALGYYRLLSPNAGVHVSPIQLRAMSIGDKWSSQGMGNMDKESSFNSLMPILIMEETILILRTS
jgi:hypothetical protein